MNFYEDFLENQKKKTQSNDNLTGKWQKTQSLLPKNTSNVQPLEEHQKPKVLIGNPNEKNEPVKFPLFNPEKTKIDKGFTKYPYYTREGLRIKNNVQSILENRIGELDARHVFDGIDDDTIERNKPVAQATIENNISNGRLTQAQLKKHPYMLDGLTMYYASVDSGNSKAARLSNNVAYSEGNYPDIIPTGINLMSNDVTASDIDSLRTSDDVVVQNNNAGKRYVGADGVRIRNGYGLNSTAMGLLNEGDEVEYTGRKTSGEIDGHYWAEIVHDGKTYWIAADYLRLEQLNSTADSSETNKQSNSFYDDFYTINPNKQKTFDLFNEYQDLEAKAEKPKLYHGDIWDGKTQEDLVVNDYSKEELIGFYTKQENPTWIQSVIESVAKPGISENDLNLSEEEHIKRFRELAGVASLGSYVTFGEMDNVLSIMINHFLDGTETDFSHDDLTKEVENHKVTKAYMSDFTKVLKSQLQLYNGDIAALIDSGSLHKALQDAGVYLSQYDYSGGDMITGLTLAIHGWTESDVEIQDFTIDDEGNYTGTLKFTFTDNFGLDYDDLPPEYVIIPGFRSWFILQHYDKYKGKYKPFKTIVEIDYPISGKIEVSK